MSLRSAIRPLDSHGHKVHAYVLQNDQRAIDTADGVVAQARLHGHHPRVYLVSGHGGCRSAACVVGFRSWYAGVCGVVLLYYRRVYVAGGCVRPGGGARWVRETLAMAAASASLMAPEHRWSLLACWTNDVKDGLAWRRHFSLPPHVLLDICRHDGQRTHVSSAGRFDCIYGRYYLQFERHPQNTLSMV